MRSLWSRKLWALDLSKSKQTKQEIEVLKETYSESPYSNLNAFSDQIFRESKNLAGIARADLHMAGQRRMLPSSSYGLSVIGHWSLDVGHWSLVVGHRWLVVGCQSLVIGHQSLVVGHWSSVVGPWLLVVNCQLLVVGCQSLVVSCWLFFVSCWLLVVGCWSLVVGHWLSVVGLRSTHNKGCWALGGLPPKGLA